MNRFVHVGLFWGGLRRPAVWLAFVLVYFGDISSLMADEAVGVDWDDRFSVGCSEGGDLSGFLGEAPGSGQSPTVAAVRRCIRGTTLPGSYDGGLEGCLSMYSLIDGQLFNFAGSQAFQGLQTQHLRRLKTRPHFMWDLVIPNNTSKVPKRISAAGIFDPYSRRLVIYGGQDIFASAGTAWVFNDTWIYPVDSGSKDWTLLTIPPPASGRYESKAVLDPIGRRMIVYGGADAADKKVGNQTLALSLDVGNEVWSEIVPAVKPPGDWERLYFGMAYDSRRHRVVIMGGGMQYGSSSGAFGDAWALPLSEPAKGWYPLTFVNSPPGPYFVGTYMFYDVVTDAYYVYLGYLYAEPKHWLKANYMGKIRELWQLKPNPDNSLTWTKLRTVFPGGYPLQAQVMWDSYGSFGLSMSGINGDSKTLGGSDYYNREVRLYLLGTGGD